MNDSTGPHIKVNYVKTDMDEALLQDPPVEEHFILRVPTAIAPHLATQVKARTLESVSFSFTEPRKGTFTFGDKSYPTALVDLPCITESLKTIDNKQFYKIANVSQMLLVQEQLGRVKEIWPHGIAPPLVNVRTSRFRARMNKKTIEDVEAEIERLLIADIESETVLWEVHERKDEESNIDTESEMETAGGDTQGDMDDYDFDDQINEALQVPEEKEEEKEESDEESEESEVEELEGEGMEGEEMDDEVSVGKKAIQSLQHEMQVLETKINEKQQLADSQANPIMKRRFIDIVAKLRTELRVRSDQMKIMEDKNDKNNGVMFVEEEEAEEEEEENGGMEVDG